MKTVQTVTGPISVEQLGKTLIHEHFVFGYPGFQGDNTLGAFDKESALEMGIAVARQVMSYGIRSVVDPTPNECGRNPEFLREISEKSGLQIICATGYYYEGEGATPYFKFRQALGTAEEEIYEMFMKEITDGIAGTGIKPGIIKLASSKDEITPYELMFFKAAARAQKETGITILTHTQEGTMGPEQAELLISLGARPENVVIGHMCGNTDVDYHKQTLKTGVNIAFDRFGIQGMVGTPMDAQRITTLLSLLSEGYANRIMLSHDTVNVWLGRPPVIPEPFSNMMTNWHPGHLFENILPTLKQNDVTDEQITFMFEANPKRLFSKQSIEV
ncbi:phosphotriesterase [Bacillus sp. HMF5848]|uniref:phosphotriesterase family protein n=1 Tax=Bacillus sp. HMF5848 TaxID=2495421 RepID=UPI000F7B1C27|nr:phosphotriesterase [Bacillus sp. HMF5848]RSK27351.1 phosphotriesterase [Bacillus sp. HMF5848]